MSTRSGGWTDTVAHHHRPGLQPETHPLAMVFPPMPADEYALLVEDIRQHGLREPVTLCEGKVLDGRHRAKACAEAGVELAYKEWEGDDPREFVLSVNLRRRHLTASQRAAVAAELATTGHGGDRRSDQAANLPLDDNKRLADELNIAERSVRHGRAVRDDAPELHAAVKAGEVAVSDAAAVADQPRAVREKALEAVREAPGKTTLAKAVKRMENGGEPGPRSPSVDMYGEVIPTKHYEVPVTVRVQVRAWNDDAAARRKATAEAKRKMRLDDDDDVVLQRPRRVDDAA